MLDFDAPAGRAEGSAPKTGRARRPWRPLGLVLSTDVGVRVGPSPARRILMYGNAAAIPDVAMPADGPSRRRSRARALWIPVSLVAGDIAAFAGAVALTSKPSVKNLIVLFIVLAVFQAGGLYRPRLNLSALDDAPAVVGRALAAGAAWMVLAGLNDGVAGTARLETCALFGVLSLGIRVLVYSGIRTARGLHHLRQRTLLLGAGTVAGRLAATLAEHPEYGLDPVGMLDDDPLLGDDERSVPVLGGSADLCRVVQEHSVNVVIVTYGSLREPFMVPLLRTCDRLACEIYFVPRLFEVHTVTRDTEVLWGIPLLRMRRAPFRSGTWMVKRLSDLVLTSAVVIALAPVLLLCALASRSETGSILHRQTRIGLDGKPFTLLKFCSLRPTESEADTRWNIGEDLRVGPMGRVMRRLSLDELPQLWNVLRGDMSLVGPRPERPFFVDEFSHQFPWYRARHRVPVGLTGWAQVHGLRGDTSIADRAHFDNFYIENWSMWGDIKILVRTVSQVLKAAGR